MVDGFRNGFDLGVRDGPKGNQPCKNGKRVELMPQVAQQIIDKEVAAGHVLGPFSEPPIPNLVYSPINLVPKAGSPNSWRLIQGPLASMERFGRGERCHT